MSEVFTFLPLSLKVTCSAHPSAAGPGEAGRPRWTGWCGGWAISHPASHSLSLTCGGRLEISGKLGKMEVCGTTRPSPGPRGQRETSPAGRGGGGPSQATCGGQERGRGGPRPSVTGGLKEGEVWTQMHEGRHEVREKVAIGMPGGKAGQVPCALWRDQSRWHIGLSASGTAR